VYTRLISPNYKDSLFLFGPRGTGKSSWVTQAYPKANYVNLLDDAVYTELLASPHKLENYVAKGKEFTILDEVQKIPALLDEVHRLIETQKKRFILTGSSARKLRRGGANLLAGRALTYHLYPLTSWELGHDFNLKRALQFGTLPKSWTTKDPKAFLKSYVATYLKEEVQAEGLTRNLAAFARFLETASFSQGQVLNISAVGSEAHIQQKVAESYFEILEDLLLAIKLPVFVRRAKRKMVAHPKFYFFDTGVFGAIRPRGPLDSDTEILGTALESFILQDFRALNEYLNWDYQYFYWRTKAKSEVDFIFYGPRGLHAVEVKSNPQVRESDLAGLLNFSDDYPEATLTLIYGGNRALPHKKVRIIPVEKWFKEQKDFF